MRLLVDLAGGQLTCGDILRLSDNYDLGPGSGPVDLMVIDLDPGCGLGLVVVSGYKAGLTFAILPAASACPDQRGIEVSWLLRHWNDWFVYAQCGDDNQLVPIPLAGTGVLHWTERVIIERPDADSRPPRS